MGKRRRTPHFITGLGDGNVHDQPRRVVDDLLATAKRNQYLRSRKTANFDRVSLAPLLHRDTFSNSGDGIPQPASQDEPWQLTAMAILAVMGILVGVFLHLVTDSGKHSYPRRQPYRAPRPQTKKKKKTDEWSDDENSDASYRADNEEPQPPKFYPYSPRFEYPQQEHRHRRPSNNSGTLTHRYHPEPVVTTYKSPSSARHQAPNRSPGPLKAPIRPKLSEVTVPPQVGLEGYQATASFEEQTPMHQWPHTALHAQPLSPASSFASIERGDEETGTPQQSSAVSIGLGSKTPASRLLTPSGSEDATPNARNIKPIARVPVDKETGLRLLKAPPLMPPSPKEGDTEGAKESLKNFPYIPVLGSPGVMALPPPPMSLEELNLVEMEIGNSQTVWQANQGEGQLAYPGRIHHKRSPEPSPKSSEPESDDPRRNIVHKRENVTYCTDAESSLQSSVDFSEVTLQSVIGGGGFGQVWKGTWRSTPVAVKMLTGQAQRETVSKATLQEFAAEINLLKGMRHPNICLYMGACFDPPNRCIITELAANGSVWDALRLPLSPPFEVADGHSHTAWPLSLYARPAGGPPTAYPARRPPLPPKGAWPWDLVKRVACGSARGMTYLHSGKPPILHRDLKSANILLDESYTAKVCDFGLSRLKAQERSMTGNCGTVQWMAPEVLANQHYAEPSDVFSFGIVLTEMLTKECPYDGMTAIQCALAVLNRDLRPEIPKWCPSPLAALIKACVDKDPSKRPTFAQILLALDAMP